MQSCCGSWLLACSPVPPKEGGDSDAELRGWCLGKRPRRENTSGSRGPRDLPGASCSRALHTSECDEDGRPREGVPGALPGGGLSAPVTKQSEGDSCICLGEQMNSVSTPTASSAAHGGRRAPGPVTGSQRLGRLTSHTGNLGPGGWGDSSRPLRACHRTTRNPGLGAPQSHSIRRPASLQRRWALNAGDMLVQSVTYGLGWLIYAVTQAAGPL